MEPDVIANLIEAAKRYYDATFDLNEAEKFQRDVDSSADANPHDIAYSQCKLWAQKCETFRAAGALLRAVEAYREANKPVEAQKPTEGHGSRALDARRAVPRGDR